MSGVILNPDAVGDPHQTPRVQLLGAVQRRRARHVYTADPQVPADHRGEVPCVCGAAKRSDLHDLPETTPEARDRDASILGEKEEDL